MTRPIIDPRHLPFGVGDWFLWKGNRRFVVEVLDLQISARTGGVTFVKVRWTRRRVDGRQETWLQKHKASTFLRYYHRSFELIEGPSGAL